MTFEEFDIWKLIAGLGIFLFGMFLLEQTLRALAGRAFKKFLLRYTKNNIRAILSGAFVTAVLQSSSVVSLMVLAFVGAGIIELGNAIGIIIGSNLGTTITGWLMASLGFKVDIESFAFPLIGIGGIGILIFKTDRLVNISKFLVGFGFLFLGLDYMKLSIESLANSFDIAAYANYGPFVFLILGFVLTNIIQASSAAMAITLSALNSGIITFEAAAAMVIGADLGTTIKVMLGAFNGIPTKKRVAVATFLFNLVTDIIAFILLVPLTYFILDVLKFENHLLALVMFHSTFNLMGIILFFPFLKLFAKLLNKLFQKEKDTAAIYLSESIPNVPEAALEALKNETRHLIDRVILLNLMIFKIDQKWMFMEAKIPALQELNNKLSYNRHYESIKQLEGEIVEFSLKIHNEQLSEEEAKILNQAMTAGHYAMSSAKYLKDIKHNLEEFENSVNDSIHNQFYYFKTSQTDFYFNLHKVQEIELKEGSFEELIDLMELNEEIYDKQIKMAYKQVQSANLNEIEIASLLNASRAIFNSNKALVRALKDLLLDTKQAEDFNNIPSTR